MPFGKFTTLYIRLCKHDNLAGTVEYSFITGTNFANKSAENKITRSLVMHRLSSFLESVWAG